jgi:ATP-dependent Lon protease
MRHLIIPKGNEKEYLELSPLVRKKLTVHLVETMDEVLGLAFQ